MINLINLIFSCHSSTQRPSTTQVTMTQHARPLRIFTVIAALSGIGMSNSYHEFHVHILFLSVLSLVLVASGMSPTLGTWMLCPTLPR